MAASGDATMIDTHGGTAILITMSSNGMMRSYIMLTISILAMAHGDLSADGDIIGDGIIMIFPFNDILATSFMTR